MGQNLMKQVNQQSLNLENLFLDSELELLCDDVDWTGKKNGFALRVHGDSMSKEFLPGDIIIVYPECQPETGDYVVAKVGKEEDTETATFKQFVRDGDQVYLKPLNPIYPVLNMTGIKFQIIGCVVQKLKVYKGIL